MARQYFNTNLADSIIANTSAVTPTTTQTSIFNPFSLANTNFPIGFGQNAPFAGQVYTFALGGIITTPATGTLVITPYYGAGTSVTAFGTSLGASAAQTVTASLSNAPFTMYGWLVHRVISSVTSSSTAVMTGSFETQGTLATAGGGWGMTYGSTASVTVDTSGNAAAGLFGAISFSVTFSVTGASITLLWTNMQSLN